MLTRFHCLLMLEEGYEVAETCFAIRQNGSDDLPMITSSYKLETLSNMQILGSIIYSL
uniref:Uncharacterized protein n=1 Tax=Arundo donax TaxID=35708 RepID=A0A0A8YKQ6_ARUDO